MLIEFLTTCTGWDLGYRTEIEEEDSKYYYFNDVNDRWTSIEKTKEGNDFMILSEEKAKQRDNIIELFEMSKDDEDFICGGEDTTYDQLMRRVRDLKK